MILAFDTSNYTTSIALLDGDDIVVDQRQLIDVKLGARGIRQSDGFFRHMQVLDAWLNAEFANYRDHLTAIAVSTKPRPVDGSYMPVFRAGQIVANTIAKSTGLPLYCCSHQEGHLFSALQGHCFDAPFLFLHLSGGTTEVHRVSSSATGYNFDIVAETADVSVGQLVDRVGVKSGLKFPCGAEMDQLAVRGEALSAPRFKVKRRFNLSGYENYFYKCLVAHASEHVYYHLFETLATIVIDIVNYAVSNTGLKTVLLAGGVAENCVIRERLLAWANDNQLDVNFAKARYASDNAVGVARYAQSRNLG